MFLRNKSESLNIILRTKLGFKKVAPQEVIEIDEKHLLTGLNSNLEVLKEMPAEAPKELEAPQQEDEGQDNEPQEQEAPVEEVNINNGEAKVETPESLEAKLDELKKAWTNTSRPKKKESIQKEIKEVQAKLDKLKENN